MGQEKSDKGDKVPGGGYVDPTRLKIFPRNLTARADYVVRGNPASSRPESGVNNSYPGLEFDQRNLDQKFFPGLIFYYHRDDGALLVDIHLTDEQRTSGLSLRDLPSSRPLYLWALYGRTMVQDPDPTLFGFRGQTGMEVWRRVNDLLPGRIATLFGPKPGFGIDFSVDLSTVDVEAILKAACAATEPRDRYKVVRDRYGNLLYAVFSADRASYLDEDGVIDTTAYQPGDLTRTMCAPWMYDFRDCYCFYWSSNKPDIVDSADGRYSYLNFIRSVGQRQMKPPPLDVDFYFNYVDGKKIQRRDYELTYQDMVEGWWHKLPVVLNDRESEVFVPDPGPSVTELLTFDEAAKELEYVATVEHALTVEYLYAYFSLNAPRNQFRDVDPIAQRIVAAASQVFQIAVEEMRHMLWANIALRMMGKPPSTARARVIGEPPSATSGRKTFKLKKKVYLARDFELAPLTPSTLQWFIDVEAPSRAADEGLDGMYVELLESVAGQPKVFPQGPRLSTIIKLIVDEGEGHWKRFTAVRQTLDGIQPERYLRPLSREEPNDLQKQYLLICDNYYSAILDAVQVSFSLGEQPGGQLVREAVRSMYNLSEVAFILAEQGFLPQFNLGERRPHVLDRNQAISRLTERAAALQTSLKQLGRLGGPREQELATRHYQRAEALFSRYQLIVRENMARE